MMNRLMVAALLLVAHSGLANADRGSFENSLPPGLTPVVEPSLIGPLDAPIQEEPRALAILRQQNETTFRLGGQVVTVRLDGSVTSQGGDFSFRFGFTPRYSQAKRRFLEDTFEQRAAIRAAHNDAAMSAALGELPSYLHAIWHHPRWSSDLRRRVLFSLWDEAAERGSDKLVAGGKQARIIIEDFIRSYAADGTQLGYSPEQLRQLNARRESRQRFEPYVTRKPARLVKKEQPALRPLLVGYWPQK